MNSPKVSIIIPGYNQADFLGEAIQSTLNQTYTNIEVVIVNDASPDNTDEIVRQFEDPRINYVVHEKNAGLAATRNTGIRNSAGEIIALLDGDDIFHPEKIQKHVDFLETHPNISVTYNSRFELNHSATTIREIVRPPLKVTLSDFVLSYPFAPSEIVIRREALFDTGLFNNSYVYFGEDGDMYCRLALAGYKFASLDRALSYRRRHSGRIIRNFDFGVREELRWLENVFVDPQCPAEVLALRDKAFSNKFLLYGCLAFGQNETSLAQGYFREAVRLDPALLSGEPCEPVFQLLDFSIADESLDHEVTLKNIFAQLPPEMVKISSQYQWAVARGYLLKGTRAVMWERLEDGRAYFIKAKKMGAVIDDSFMRQLASQLRSYEKEFGFAATDHVISNLQPYLTDLGSSHSIRTIKGYYSVNGAFENYRDGHFNHVPSKVINAISNNPKYIINRGVLAILFRSLRNTIGADSDRVLVHSK